jgi:cyclase
MGKCIRIVSKLDIKGPNVVKGMQFEGLRVLGIPGDFASKYYRDGIDEIVYLDIVASLYQRSFDREVLKSVANQIFVPLSVGGGIKSANDINNALRSGADKVIVNTYVLRHNEILDSLINTFGSQCIVLSVEAKKIGDKKWEAYSDGGRERSGVDAVEWIKRAVKIGVGEVLITSVDRDGTRLGFDMDLIREVCGFCPVPVIACGGAKSKEDVKDIISNSDVDAVAIASAFHYNLFSISELKNYLTGFGINVRR